MALRDEVSGYWFTFRQQRFPRLAQEFGELGAMHRRLVRALELVRVEEAVPRGRSAALAFLARTLFHLPTTRALVERPGSDAALRRLGMGGRRTERGNIQTDDVCG